MAAAMVFTDRLVDREWERWRPRLKVRIGDVLLKVNKARPYQSYMQHYQRVNPSLKPFCAATREYLRRKVWWYFRTLAKQSPDDYANAASFALRSYHIDDVDTGIGLMQRWSLLHVAYGAHLGLRFSSRRAILRDGFTLRDIVESSQPRFPDIWRSEVGQRALLRVRNEARAPTDCRLVPCGC